MRISQVYRIFSVIFVTTLACQAQIAFQDLDFESATLAPTASQFGGAVPIGAALPGWSASIGDAQLSQINQNFFTTGAASIDILGPNWNTASPGIIGGNFTVLLEPGFSNPSDESASIQQTGFVPANAESLQFKAWGILANPTFLVSFDGNSLSPVTLSSGETPSGQPYTTYGVDISSYAGGAGELQLTVPFSSGGLNGVEFDDITFSTISVAPEPTTLMLFLTGGAVLGLRCWRRKMR